MWFDSLMDDFKASLQLSSSYKGVFVPVFLKLLMFFAMGVFIAVGAGVVVLWGIFISEMSVAYVVRSIIFMMVLGYILFVVLWSLIEVGSINLYRVAISGEKPCKEHFFSGIRGYMKKVFAGKLLIHFLFLILSPIWIVLFLIYAFIIGIPTAGWGIVFLMIVVGMYFATWTIAIVHDDLGVGKGLGASFRLARSHFKPMFILVLTMYMVGQYAVSILGPVGFAVAGWFIGGVVKTYFRIILYKTYIRYGKTSDGAKAWDIL
jgi:hypothetical protein